MSRLSSAAVRTLAAALRGSVLSRSDASFDVARRELLWNRLPIERRPELIVRVAEPQDVVQALACAREHGLRVAVRCGGHSFCGAPVRDGALVLDVGGLRRSTIDAATRTAVVQPGVTGGALARALAAHGLAFPAGHCASVPLGGYVLAGGIGWNSRAWGFACRSLRALDVVLADGTRVTASADEHPELLWAARGGAAGFFGVATLFVLDLHPLPSHVHAGTLVHRIEDASEVASWVDATAPLLPTEVELTLFLARAEDGDGAVCIVAATAFASTPDEARRMLAFVDASPARPRALVAEPVSPTGFDALFANVARFFPEGSRYLGDTAWLAGGLASAIDLLCARLAAAPPGRCFFLCAIRPVLPSGAGGCAVAPLGTVLVNCYAGWDDPAQDAAHVAWHDATMGALAPLTAGHYVGESDVVAHPSRAMRSYPAASWQRLAALRERFDPDRLFHDWSG